MIPAIRIRNLGKRYHVGAVAERTRYHTLRESLVSLTTAPVRRWRRRSDGAAKDFWALRDMTFDIQPGEVLGVVGRNGAGKSTLLKILSRITNPTTGEVELHGRIGSLLEVGTGFHPELTGRENILLNGAILGMRRAEILSKFDAIVEFAGVERFLETPVKRYSSGMYVRLAFAVAAHLEPEILLVDEVLAVGDQAFQKKCIGKMGDIAASGRTVLLVSHNLPMLSRLSSRAIWINEGRLEQEGDPGEVIAAYCAHATRSLAYQASASLIDHPGRAPGKAVFLRAISLRDEDGLPVTSVPLGGTLAIDIELENQTERAANDLVIDLCDTFGTIIARANSYVQSALDLTRARTATVRCTIEDLRLLPGDYVLNLYLGDGEEYLDRVDSALTVSIEPSDLYGTGRNVRYGICALDAHWSLRSAAAVATT